MKFILQKEGTEPREWDFKPERMNNLEAEQIEKASGMLYPEWTEAVMRGSMTAVHALLWTFLKRTQPSLPYDSVEFCPADYDMIFDADEMTEHVATYDAAVAAGEDIPAEYARQIEAMRAELPPAPEPDAAPDLDAVEDPESFEPEGPKGRHSPGSIFDDATDGTSPTTSTLRPLSSTG